MSKMNQILKDEMLSQKLKEDGYVVISFLNEEEINALTKIFYDNHKDKVEHFYATAHVEDIDFRNRMNLEIREVYSRAIEENFVGCTALGGSFVVKPKGETGVLDPHQDWNIVDEEKYRSFNVWVPLVDLTKDNGVIYVLPKSHKWVEKTYRHSTIPNVYGQVYDQVWENMIPLYMKAGEALVYDHALVHASELNQTDELRIACAYGVIPEEAEMIFYWNNDGKVEKYQSNPDFFMEQNIFTGPHGLTKLDDVDYDFHQVTVDEFYEISGIEPPKKEEPVAENEVETKSFWQVYTPKNIIREIKFRLTGS